MTNEELEMAFEDALEKWRNEPSNPTVSVTAKRMIRFFFYAGFIFGVEETKKIYSEVCGK